MVRRSYIILLCAVLVSCAQVGRISGGQKDTSAPKIVVSKSTKNGLTNFTGTEISLVFDEFISLNNPVANILLVPSDATVETSLHGRSLLIKLNGQLQPETTYALYFNRAIRDITEGNDSLFQYVFSTGEKLDSISFSGQIIDAEKDAAIKNVTVLLTSIDQPNNKRYASSASNGHFKFDYLPVGDYSLLAFVDGNIDGEYQNHESVGFPLYERLHLEKSIVDTTPMRVFSPVQEPSLHGAFINDYAIGLGSNFPISNLSKLAINGVQIDPSFKINIREDSVLYLLSDTLRNAQITYETTDILDTITLRRRIQNDNIFKIFHKTNSSCLPGDTVQLFITDRIEKEHDELSLSFISAKDTLLIPAKVNYKGKILFKSPDIPGTYSYQISANEVQTLHGKNEKFEGSVVVLDSTKLCGLTVNLKGFDSDLIVYLLKGDDLVDVRLLSKGDFSTTFLMLEANEYHIKVVEDINNNGVWDTGDYQQKKQPENAINFLSIIKLRSGWDSEVDLEK